jgi:hypothetical protein
MAESKLGTDYAKPEVEREYHNCGGWKSEEILRTHKADAKGSWLMYFGSWREYFAYVSGRLQTGYLDKGCTTPECITKWYVGGGGSPRWIEATNTILNQIND